VVIGHDLAQEVTYWRLMSRVASRDVNGGRSDTEADSSLNILGFPPPIITAPSPLTHLSPPLEAGDSPQQAAHYHDLACCRDSYLHSITMTAILWGQRNSTY
jgi:hypothetical protein